MTKILMRAQMNHDKSYSPEEVFLGNCMGGNSGNWLYQFSLYRALLKDENVQIDTVNFSRVKLNDEYIDYINNNYDYCILPFANAFKNSFKKEMLLITRFIKALKIPCIVPGIGLQIKLGNDFYNNYEHKEAAIEFVKAILEKSQMIGVRGQATADFLSKLGFQQEKDFTVIGCPSMYTHGAKLPEVKPLNFNQDSRLLLSSKVEHENKKVVQMYKNFSKEHPNYVYAPQQLNDIIQAYYGIDFSATAPAKKRFFNKKNTVCFTSVPQWINYLHNNVDLSVGTRIHGNVAPILSGVPSFIIALDQRVNELAEYHNIPHTTIDKITPKTTIASIINNTDFESIHTGHKDRFNHFVDFLEKNGLKTAYSEDRNIQKVYFDSISEKFSSFENVQGYEACDEQEKIQRTRNAASFYRSCYRKSLDDLNSQKKLFDKEKKQMKNQLDEQMKRIQEEKEQKNSDGFFSRLFSNK